MKYVSRMSTAALRRRLKTYPVVLVYGPRQCGKSTWVHHELPGWKHVDLEREGERTRLASDLEGYFLANPRHIVMDEAQRLPALFETLRPVADSSGEKGRFVLLGSASPALLRGTSESLAGRVGLLELTPFRVREWGRRRRWEDLWFWGGLPPVHAIRSRADRTDWLSTYVATFLERDLPALGIRLSAMRLRKLWTMLTHVHGGILKITDLARALMVSVPTIASDLDVLESAFMIRRLQPYRANIAKRLVKAPKIYLRDTGLLHFLSDLRRPEEFETWPRRGQSFEGLAIEELITLASLTIAAPQFFFWRTATGTEVDLLVVDGKRIYPIEIKLGRTVDPSTFASMRQCMADLGLKRGWIVYTGDAREEIGGGIEMVPWKDVVAGKSGIF